MEAQTIIPRFETISINEGLPHSSVYSILQDKKGFMWFGTPDGLCRYDGCFLKSYKYTTVNENGTPNNYVRGKLQEDKNGNIWYCNESGIYQWNRIGQRVLQSYNFQKKYFHNSQFVTVELDEHGILWLMNLTVGIVSYDIETHEIRSFPFPITFKKANIQYTFNTVDDKGNIWLRVVTGNEPFLKFNKLARSYTIEMAKDPPHAIFFDKQKEVLAFDDRLVIKKDDDTTTITIFKTIGNKKISFFSFNGLKDSHNRIWMTARGSGLFYFDENNKTFHEYHHESSKIKTLPFDLTTCLFIDRSDNLWIGIDGGGVAKIDLKQPKFNLFPLNEGDHPVLRDYFTKCLYEDEKGLIWFGSHNNGLSIYDAANSKLTNYKSQPANPNSLPGNVVASIYKDTKGNMWIGTNAGISIFNQKTASFSNIPISGLPKLHPDINLFVYKFLELKNGDFLIATLLGLVKVYKTEAGLFQGIYYGNKSFLASTTTDVVEMEDGSLFITLPGIGLYHIRPTANGFDSLKIFFSGLDLRSARMDEKQKDKLWIGSGIGLIEFNIRSGKSKIWDDTRGLANSYVYGSLEDEKHNLWVSTNGGLSYIDRKANHVDNFTFQDGLQSNEFNTQAFYKSKTNTFYFGGIKGFNWFQSKSFAANQQKPQAAITQLEVDNIPFAVDSALLIRSYVDLPYDRNDLNFKFAALDYTRPEANKIQYKLQGWDANWITTYERSARYSNLPPGKYTMLVKASNAAGMWSNEESLSITIQKPFWITAWFYLLLLAVFIFTVIFLTYTILQQRVKRQLRKLEKQAAINIERNRISKDMHDEIGNGLTHIALLSEIIQQHNLEISVKRDITGISTSARKLVQTMSEIIWALSPQNDTLDNLLAYTREQSQQYFEGMHVDFTIHFPEVIPGIKLSNEERRNLFLVTKEALSNALKHSKANQIILSLVVTKSMYRFSVTDNGVGLASNKLKVGNNGLKNMNKRMEDIGGTIEWINAEKGTRVEYCLPCK